MCVCACIYVHYCHENYEYNKAVYRGNTHQTLSLNSTIFSVKSTCKRNIIAITKHIFLQIRLICINIIKKSCNLNKDFLIFFQ